MTQTNNPYEPILVDDTSPDLLVRRSYLLAIIAGFFALIAFGLASLVLLETIPIAKRQGISGDIKWGFVVIATFATFALIWLTAVYFAWNGSKRWALIITVVNLFAFAMFFVFLTV